MAKPAALPPTQELWAQYQTLGSVHRLSLVYGCSADRIKRALNEGGYILNSTKWSDADDLRVIRYFDDTSPQVFDPGALAAAMGRTTAAVMTRAAKLGVLEPADKRSKKDTQTAQTKRASLEFLSGVPAEGEPVTRAEAVETRTAKTGKWRSGWYTVGDKRIFFRSLWEVRWAHYLEWRVARGEINRWEYEPDRYVFHEVESNNRIYIPDFKVWTDPETFHYEEIKGWYSPRDRVKMARMTKYYPDIRVVLVDEPVYREVEAKLSRVIPGWWSA